MKNNHLVNAPEALEFQALSTSTQCIANEATHVIWHVCKEGENPDFRRVGWGVEESNGMMKLVIFDGAPRDNIYLKLINKSRSI